jgi:Flp pilus assembly protein TadD
MHPDYHHPHVWLALAYEQKRDWPNAVAEMEKAYALDGQTEALAQLGHIYASAGRTGEARRVLMKLAELSRRQYVSAYNFAVLYAALGDRDRAFQELAKVEQDRGEWFSYAGVDPRLDSLRPDPRFAGVLRAVGLTPDR